ncbi:MAG: PPOX class F420-dependent oxidoreductase [Streptosporangiaceae bacterium]
MRTVSEPGQVPAQLQPFVRQRTILLQTRKRDGSWVPTPVHIAVGGDRAYIRTYAKAGKSKRLRNFPEVRFGPSTMRGRPTGATVHARARLLAGDEARTAARALSRKYRVLHGLMIPQAHRLMRTSTLHYELSDFQPNSV